MPLTSYISRAFSATALFAILSHCGSIYGQATTPALSTESGGTTTTQRSSVRNSYTRLARAPNMFGDSLGIGGTSDGLGFIGEGGGFATTTNSIPAIGGGGSTKIAENSCTLPADRVFMNYNHYVNAYGTSASISGDPAASRTYDVDQATLGFEKTYHEGECSIEVRMPFNNDFAFNDGLANSGAGGNYGNLTVYFKALLLADESFAFGGGLGFGLPTGSDFTGTTLGQEYEIQNDAVHILPYIGLLYAPSDVWFTQTFLQLDLSANGNDVIAGPPVTSGPSVQAIANPTLAGVYNAQNLAQFDFAVGRWLYFDPTRRIQGIAAVFELHYTTTLQNTDTVAIGAGVSDTTLVIGNGANRLDILNATLGANFQISPLANMRAGFVVPLDRDPNRLFDNEFQFSFNKFF